jgi:hypothetical protein
MVTSRPLRTLAAQLGLLDGGRGRQGCQRHGKEHDHLHERAPTPFVSGFPGLPRATLKLNIMPLCMCSAMWQWAIHGPGLDTSNSMSMLAFYADNSSA